MGKTGTDTVFGYKYLTVGDRTQQQAWFKWKLNNPLLYHFIINDEYFFLDSDYYLQSIKLVQTEDDPSTSINNVDFLLHVDNHTTVSGGSFNSATNTTTFSSVGWLNTVTTPNHDLVVIDTNTNSARVGRYANLQLMVQALLYRVTGLVSHLRLATYILTKLSFLSSIHLEWWRR